MTSYLSPAGRAVFATASLPPFLLALVWAHLLLSPGVSVTGVVSALLASVASATAAVIALRLAAAPARGGIAAAVLAAGVAFLIPIASASLGAALVLAGNFAAMWLLVFGGQSFIQIAAAAAHLIAAAIDVATFGVIALFCAIGTTEPFGRCAAATAVVLIPFLLVRAFTRHGDIWSLVHSDPRYLQVVAVPSNADGTPLGEPIAWTVDLNTAPDTEDPAQR
jgi:hypothetical protein